MPRGVRLIRIDLVVFYAARFLSVELCLTPRGRRLRIKTNGPLTGEGCRGLACPGGIKVSPQIQSHNRDDPAVNSAGGTGYSTLRKWPAAIAKQRDGKRGYTRARAMPAKLRSQGPIGLTQHLSQPIDTERLG